MSNCAASIREQKDPLTSLACTISGYSSYPYSFTMETEANVKLDDHVRDVPNWVAFYEARGHWINEREAVEQCASYLTGRMHRTRRECQPN